MALQPFSQSKGRHGNNGRPDLENRGCGHPGGHTGLSHPAPDLRNEPAFLSTPVELYRCGRVRSSFHFHLDPDARRRCSGSRLVGGFARVRLPARPGPARNRSHQPSVHGPYRVYSGHDLASILSIAPLNFLGAPLSLRTIAPLLPGIFWPTL